MKTALWFLSQYSHPYVNVTPDKVSVEDERVVIDTDAALFKINTDSHEDAVLIKEGIITLCDYKTADFNITTGYPVFEEVIETLYTHGHIINYDISLFREKEIALLITSLQSLLKKYTRECIDEIAEEKEIIDSDILPLLCFLRSELQRKSISCHVWESENFYLISLCVLMHNAKNNNPYAYVLIKEFIKSLDSHLNSLHYSPEIIINAEILYLYSIRDIEACLYAFKSLLISSLGTHSKRATYHLDAYYETRSGINFALLSEAFSRDYSVHLGESKFLQALLDPDNHLLLAPACYIQEYFVNYRFTETITPMMSKRLSGAMRDAFVRYYDEEVGHELYELDTCINLGVKEAYLEKHLPLPLTQIFCDAYTYLSSMEPLPYFTSVMVTEGIPGEPSLINEILTQSKVLQHSFNDASKEHEKLNVELGHQYLSRRFLSRIHSVDDAEQKKSLHILAWMLELNHRAWEELYQRIYVERKEYLEPATL